MNDRSTYPVNDITCAILAGGKGSRMGDRDKGLVELAGRPLIEHIIERIAPQVGHIIINANRNLDEYRRYGHPVVTDAADEFAGPLAGMAASLHYGRTPRLLTVPCDTPLLPHDLAVRLHTALQAQHADLAVVHDGQRLHPVFCLLCDRLINSLDRFLIAGGRKIDLWFEETKTAHADFSDEADCFDNINTAEKLSAVEQRLATA